MSLTRWLGLLGLIWASAALSADCLMIAPADVLADYHQFLQGRQPMSVRTYDGVYARRDVVELVLIQKALWKGGYRHAVKMVEASSYARILRELEQGRATLAGTSVWVQDIQRSHGLLLASPSLIREGEMMAGLYVAPDNAQASRANTLDRLRRLRAVSNRDWISDWQTLTRLGFVDIENVPLWDSMVRMVASQRVDVLLAPFQSRPGLVLEHEGSRLVPIAGVKVRLPGARAVAVSHVHPEGAAVFLALRKGLTLLRAQGEITRAYREAGFFQPQTANWTILNP